MHVFIQRALPYPLYFTFLFSNTILSPTSLFEYFYLAPETFVISSSHPSFPQT